MISILIADDHPMVRSGLAVMLRTERDIWIVGEAENGIEAVQKAKELQPNIVLMDLQMPDLDGIGAMKEISIENPDIKFIVLTTYETDEYIFKAIKAGARAYLLKDCSAEELLSVVRAVDRGELLLGSEFMEEALDHPVSLSPRTQGPEALSEREIEIMKIISQGASNKGIASQLSISENTVKTHITNILGKLGAGNRAEAIAEAVRRGIIDV